MEKPYPFEYVSTYEAYTNKRFLIADEMGMFKTAQAIFVNNVIRDKNKALAKALVVCPTSVKEHWAREIEKWCYPKNQKIIIIHATKDFSKAKEADWSIVHYPLLSRISDPELEKLEKTKFRHVILDEVHNAKNPEAIRSKAVKKLAEKAEYLTMLSGTPIPNTIIDIYMLIHLLDPNQFPLGDKNTNNEAKRQFLSLYSTMPEMVKRLFHQRMIARKAKDYIQQRLPLLEEKNIEIPMEGDWLEIYNEILDQELPIGKKIAQLEKALLDTDLVDKTIISKRKSLQPKYETLDEIVAETVKNKKKVLIYTNLKEGVVNKLVERYKKYGAIAITGDIPTGGKKSLREELRWYFQNDPHTKVLIATTAMHEGVDLTAAAVVVNLMLPWTPAEYWQRIARAHRPGEVEQEKITVYNLIAKYPAKRRKSLDEAIWDMLKSKQEIIEYLLAGLKLTKEDFAILQEPKKVPTIKKAIRSDSQLIFMYYYGWRGKGTKKVMEIIKKRKKIAEIIASLYFNFNMAKNAADCYIPLIEQLKPEEPWLDLAGGPGMLSYYTKKSSHVVDISYEMLKAGKEKNNGWFVQASFSQLPYKEESFGLVVCSLALQMAEPKRERAQVLQQINYVLKPQGYAIIVLPPSYLNQQNYEEFKSALDAYGFKLLQHKSGLTSSNLELFVIQKINKANKKVLDLTWKGDLK
ncbi:MAG: SNF2-related protein [Candidatus Pacearchaeota archaeon]